MRRQSLVFLSMLAIFGLTRTKLAHPKLQSEEARPINIAGENVKSFHVDHVPLVDALLLFAQQEKIPMGIEYLDERSLQEPISLDLGTVTVSQVLAQIFSHGRGYSWSVLHGVVNISHTGVPTGRENLLDYVLPVFDAPRASLDDLSWQLQMALDQELHPEIKGWAGDYIPSEPAVLAGPIHVRHSTVREILSRIVGQGNASAWVVLVAPGNLSRIPSKGLWKILPYTRPGTRYAPLLLQSLQQQAGAEGSRLRQ